MLYTKAHYWIENGVVWHSLSNNGRDLSMGSLRPWEVEKSIAWARSHNMQITDDRQTSAEA